MIKHFQSGALNPNRATLVFSTGANIPNESSTGTKVILLNGEVGGLYDFIKIGDSISKVEDNNGISIRRFDLDTIIPLRFYESE